MSIADIQQNIKEDFDFLENWDEKFEYLISLGKSLSPMQEKYKTDENLIKGCQSKVWIFANKIEDKLIFESDSDAIITKGIVALLMQVFSNRTAKEILEADTKFIDEIGLKEHLSPNRANGLVSMIKEIKLYALALEK
ncbi:MAG: SufE family protein [Flavobacterium sp.]